MFILRGSKAGRPFEDGGVFRPEDGVDTSFEEKPFVPFETGAPPLLEFFQFELRAAGCLGFGAPPKVGNDSSDISKVGWASSPGVSSFCFPAVFTDTGFTHPGAASSPGASRMLEDLGSSLCFKSASSGTSSIVGLWGSACACFCMSNWALVNGTSGCPFWTIDSTEAMMDDCSALA